MGQNELLKQNTDELLPEEDILELAKAGIDNVQLKIIEKYGRKLKIDVRTALIENGSEQVQLALLDALGEWVYESDLKNFIAKARGSVHIRLLKDFGKYFSTKMFDKYIKQLPRELENEVITISGTKLSANSQRELAEHSTENMFLLLKTFKETLSTAALLVMADSKNIELYRQMLAIFGAKLPLEVAEKIVNASGSDIYAEGKDLVFTLVKLFGENIPQIASVVKIMGKEVWEQMLKEGIDPTCIDLPNEYILELIERFGSDMEPQMAANIINHSTEDIWTRMLDLYDSPVPEIVQIAFASYKGSYFTGVRVIELEMRQLMFDKFGKEMKPKAQAAYIRAFTLDGVETCINLLRCDISIEAQHAAADLMADYDGDYAAELAKKILAIYANHIHRLDIRFCAVLKQVIDRNQKRRRYND